MVRIKYVKTLRDCLAQAVASGRQGSLCVLQVGSFGNGTALRSSTEVELVVFLSCFRSFQEEAEHHHAVLRLIWKKLWHCQDLLALGLEVIGVVQGVPDALVFTIQTMETTEPITVTIVPAYRAMGKGRGSPPDSHTCPSQETCNCLPSQAWLHADSCLHPFSPCPVPWAGWLQCIGLTGLWLSHGSHWKTDFSKSHR